MLVCVRERRETSACEREREKGEKRYNCVRQREGEKKECIVKTQYTRRDRKDTKQESEESSDEEKTKKNWKEGIVKTHYMRRDRKETGKRQEREESSDEEKTKKDCREGIVKTQYTRRDRKERRAVIKRGHRKIGEKEQLKHKTREETGKRGEK